MAVLYILKAPFLSMGLLEKWFIPPLMEGSGYNPVNTIVLALLFILMIWGVLILFRKEKIRLDKAFFKGWAGWILAIASMRVLDDAGVLTGWFMKTPFIDLWMLIPALALLFAANRFLKKKDFDKWGLPFYLIFLVNIVLLPFSNIEGGLKTLVVFAPWLFFLVLLRPRWNFMTRANMLVLAAHLFDASATFTAMHFYGAAEAHVLPSFLINMFGPWAMFPLKLAVLIPVLWYIDKESKGYENKFLKLVIFTLGAGTGLRDFFQIMTY